MVAMLTAQPIFYMYVMLCFLCLCCCIPYRARRCEPARRGVCEWQTPTWRGQAKNRGARAPRSQTLWHLKTTTGQPWLCQQNSRKVRKSTAVVNLSSYTRVEITIVMKCLLHVNKHLKHCCTVMCRISKFFPFSEKV